MILEEIPTTGQRPSPAAEPGGVWLDRTQPNALNFLRLVFASTVVFAHCWAFGQFGADPLGLLLRPWGDAAGNAVNGFFIISGFLITGSWLSRKSAESYLRARVARIWPGFAAAFFVSAAIAAIAAGHAWLAYLRSIPAQGWFEGLFTLNGFKLDRALSFAANPYPHTVNGPMWTIRIEFCCYLAVALAGSVGLLRRWWPPVVFTLLAIAFAAHEQVVLPATAWLHWARFGAFFGSGSLAYIFRRHIPRSRWLALGCLLLLGLVKFVSTYLIVPIAGTYLLLYLGFSAPGWVKRLGARNDISYGVYLYGGPLGQLYFCYAAKSLLPMNPWVAFVAVLPLTVACGWLSWLFIERPAKRWLR